MADRGLEVLNDLGTMLETGAWSAHRAATVRRGGADSPRILVLKLRQADALALAERLAGVNALSMAPSEQGVIVRAWADTRDLGVLTVLPGPEPHIGELAISQGGAVRPHFWAHELVASHVVAVRVPQGTGNAAKGWPEASATLLRFAAPLKPEGMPTRMAAEVLRMASNVWSGVVLADLQGRPEVLDDVRDAVRRRGAPAGLVELLVERKRRIFAEDLRLLRVEDVARLDGEVTVVVHATVPRT